MSKGSKQKRDERRKRETKEQNRQVAKKLLRHLSTSRVGENSSSSLSIPPEKLGAPGIPHELHAVAGPAPGIVGDHAYSMAAMNDTSERDFRIVAHLAKEPGSFSGDLSISVDPTHGASLIEAPPGFNFAVLQTTFGEVQMALNSTNEVAGLEFRCRARSSREVLNKYSDVLASLIDHMSFNHDIPIFVRYVALWDEKNRILTASYVAPYRKVTPSGNWTVFDLELRPFYALYREALTNPSVYYQFLCYAKVLEGAFRWLFPRLRREAASRAVEFPKLDIRIEDHPELEGEARKWVGRSVQQAFNDYLQGEFRDAIAHFAKTDEEPIVTSNYISSATVANNLLLARICARSVILAAEQVVRFLKNIPTAATP
ncbi:methylamine utilization protein MauJ [Archangium lipolyticum]|uniref:methylamine utilization protein MauJ n=1 Tax=Archangium lipolyticum TaxID=2970465 RepID=UPI002149D086|nr:methylamine utilization protein MauJ [Archangium lipolyticum]